MGFCVIFISFIIIIVWKGEAERERERNDHCARHFDVKWTQRMKNYEQNCQRSWWGSRERMQSALISRLLWPFPEPLRRLPSTNRRRRIVRACVNRLKWGIECQIKDFFSQFSRTLENALEKNIKLNVKFVLSKKLVFLADFFPSSIDSICYFFLIKFWARRRESTREKMWRIIQAPLASLSCSSALNGSQAPKKITNIFVNNPKRQSSFTLGAGWWW